MTHRINGAPRRHGVCKSHAEAPLYLRNGRAIIFKGSSERLARTLSPADGDRGVGGAVDKSFRGLRIPAVQHVPTNEASPNIGVLTSRSAVESTRDHAIDSLTR